ncbi:O-antigen ligase [Tianweitania sp.]|uniref:O-antigen ligase family protein n=1 Tax=Tianweitania sp. TaxID=2021634 RepID=UPI00289A058C|nr:O-antigen ligase [Tianweitania sp.]
MSSIASLKRTDRSFATIRDEIIHAFPPHRVAMLLAMAIFAALLVSFRPFTPAGQAEVGGDFVNQVGYGCVAIGALFGLFCFVDRRVASALLSPWWLILIVLLFVSVSNALDPGQALRAVLFTIVGILGIAAVLTLPRGADAFSQVLAWVSLGVVAYCYVGLVIYPDIAVTPVDNFEPQNAGSWRGLYAHKNIAGPVMACLSFAGIYLFRRGWQAAGAILFVAAFFFLFKTDSKTTTGLAPVAILCVAGPTLFGLRGLTPAILVGSVVAAALLTLGMVFIEPVKVLMQHLFPDLTYTGRTTIWEFAGQMIAARPWSGYGLESFWTTRIVSDQLQPFDRAWDLSSIVHGHNGYIDVALSIGVPGMLIAIIAFVLAPARDFVRTPLKRENVLLADLFMMIVLFTCLNAFLESFFFRRADPVWLLFVFGVLGLRMTARFPVKA